MRALRLFVILLTVLVTSAFSTEESNQTIVSSETSRPKICLVLSGGGARGAAHIGVIKVLEEHRVPIDCIVGTSMGALVGAAYASGTSVDDMEKLITGLSTQVLFQDTPPRKELDIRRKIEDYSRLFSPEMGTGALAGTQLRKGIVSGVQLETVLREISAPGYRDFDKLPIPYRAIATNLVTGEAEVFDKGELAHVMRASMSVPVAIAPIEINNKILVDGMLTDNLPIDVARSMGAEIIIAVNVGTPLMKREDLDSIRGVASQMISILTEQNVQKSLALLKPSDILISPDLGDFSTGDFDNLQDILPTGEKAAHEVSDRLSQLSASAEEYAQYHNKIHNLAIQDTRPVDVVDFKPLARVNPRYLRTLMETKPHVPLDHGRLNNDLRRLYGTGDFEHVGFHIAESDDNRTLVIDALEKSWGPDYIRFGLGFDSDFQGNADYSIQGRFRQTWLNSYGAEWITDIQLGSNNWLASEFYQPLNPEQDYFIAPSIEFKQDRVELYSGDQHISTYLTERYRIGMDAGQSFGTYGQIRLGVTRGVVKPSRKTGLPITSSEKETISQGGLTAKLLLDKLDSIKFPTDGWFVKGDLYKANKTLGADDTYTKWDARALGVQTFDGHTISLFGMAAGSLDEELPYYDRHQLGGFLRQSGYQSNQFFAESFLFGRFMYYHQLVDYAFMNGLYAGFSLEAGKLKNPVISTNSTDSMYSGSIFVASDTPIGPIYFGYGRAESADQSFYLFLGLPY